MIKTFGNQVAADLFREMRTKEARKLPSELWRTAQRKLKAIDAAISVADLVVPSGNRLKVLKGEQAGRHSIRINDQYRITFRWEATNAFEVCVEDYH
jgi:toxin HigB-1